MADMICTICGRHYDGRRNSRYCAECSPPRVKYQAKWRAEHRDHIAAYNREYFSNEQHRADQALRAKRWHEAHQVDPEKRRAAEHKYQTEHKAEIAARKSAYYADHKEEIAAYYAEYYRAHKSEYAARLKKRREKQAEGKPPKPPKPPKPSPEERAAKEREYHAAYYLAHKAEIAAYYVEYYRAHKAEIAEKRRLKRQKEKEDNV